MKYGDQLEQESVPEWSLHNVDYNALKHEIKVHTSRDQATAIAIPGHVDPALLKFEDRLYQELCNQHDRVDMFIGSKADEIGRRLDTLSGQVNRIIAKGDRDTSGQFSLKRQRRFARYERDLLRCEEDVLALSRFIHAQTEAFRKITKKYKKWTGSPTLGIRFRENVLINPKSFARRDLTHLQNQYEEILARLRAASPQLSEPSSPSTTGQPSPTQSRAHSQQQGPTHTPFTGLPPPQTHYWNEYDDGSDGDGAGQHEEYTIYINPGNGEIPGLNSLRAILKRPLNLASSWFSSRRDGADPSRRSLLGGQNGNGSGAGYGGISPFNAEATDDDLDYASSEDMPVAGYAGYYAALPSVNEQRIERYREKLLSWMTFGSFVAAFVFLAVAGILITTGRHKLRIEVDAGVTVGAVSSLFCACLGLGMTLQRKDPLGVWYRAAVWTSFMAACVLNGMLLILVVGNTA